MWLQELRLQRLEAAATAKAAKGKGARARRWLQGGPDMQSDMQADIQADMQAGLHSGRQADVQLGAVSGNTKDKAGRGWQEQDGRQGGTRLSSGKLPTSLRGNYQDGLGAGQGAGSAAVRAGGMAQSTARAVLSAEGGEEAEGDESEGEAAGTTSGEKGKEEVGSDSSTSLSGDAQSGAGSNQTLGGEPKRITLKRYGRQTDADPPPPPWKPPDIIVVGGGTQTHLHEEGCGFGAGPQPGRPNRKYPPMETVLKVSWLVGWLGLVS